MTNKEQLLYFFLQGKISLSQYDYKFMANLQTLIQNNSRVTSNQADLFDKLISKYKKQLVRQGLVKEELKELPWKTMIVESTTEYTGAVVLLRDDELNIRVPFNKSFISEFRNVRNNTFEWSKETKTYSAPFGTSALKVAYTTLPKFFSTVRYDDDLQTIIDELKQYEGLIWNPTLTKYNGELFVTAINPILAELIKDTELTLEPQIIFNLTCMGITIDSKLYEASEKLKFAASWVYEVELSDVENTIGWMKNVGCENVVIGRGLRSTISQEHLSSMIEKYGMKPMGPLSYGNLPEGVSMLMQHTSNVDSRTPFTGQISKTVVLKDSRPIEVK
jgi:hypothetical protein